MQLKEKIQDKLGSQNYSWLVTGADGFIGSHLVEALLDANQKVTALDDLSACARQNLNQIEHNLESGKVGNLNFINADITNVDSSSNLFTDIDFVLHHAAIGSVPLSIEQPDKVAMVNEEGFRRTLKASIDAGVKRFVYASSSAVYGDTDDGPNSENAEPSFNSPYAEGKYNNELDASRLTKDAARRAARYIAKHALGCLAFGPTLLTISAKFCLDCERDAHEQFVQPNLAGYERQIDHSA